MTDILIPVAVAAFLLAGLVALLLATFRELHDDGAHAHRPPPPSHQPDPFDPANTPRSRLSI